MTNDATRPQQAAAEAAPQASPPRAIDPALWARFWSTSQLIAALAITVAVLIYLLAAPGANPTSSEGVHPSQVEIVQAIGPGLIRIEPGASLEKKLQIVTVQATPIDSPVLFVTGTVAASLRPGLSGASDVWQFNAPEVLTAYTDWQRAVADIAFTETQLARTRELTETRINAQTKLVERMKKLVDAGTDTPKDLAAEQNNLLQFQLQGEKENYEAETAVRLAKRNEAALARQLQQAGFDTELLTSSTSDVDVVMAEVPEGALSAVKLGQGCRARFFGLPNEVFTGKVNGIAPVLSKERRSLRVLFIIHDPKDQLRPGMFAEIGLGTDLRDALLIPAGGIVHIGGSDYVLAAGEDAGVWRVTEVQVGEPHDGRVEVISGLRPNDRIMGQGAILLKPAMVKSLQPVINGGKHSAPENRR